MDHGWVGAENGGVGVQVAKNSMLQQIHKQLQACGIMHFYADPIPHCACITLTPPPTYVLSVLTYGVTCDHAMQYKVQ